MCPKPAHPPPGSGYPDGGSPSSPRPAQLSLFRPDSDDAGLGISQGPPQLPPLPPAVPIFTNGPPPGFGHPFPLQTLAFTAEALLPALASLVQVHLLAEKHPLDSPTLTSLTLPKALAANTLIQIRLPPTRLLSDPLSSTSLALLQSRSSAVDLALLASQVSGLVRV